MEQYVNFAYYWFAKISINVLRHFIQCFFVFLHYKNNMDIYKGQNNIE
jgi:hypothetical protein